MKRAFAFSLMVSRALATKHERSFHSLIRVAALLLHHIPTRKFARVRTRRLIGRVEDRASACGRSGSQGRGHHLARLLRRLRPGRLEKEAVLLAPYGLEQRALRATSDGALPGGRSRAAARNRGAHRGAHVGGGVSGPSRISPGALKPPWLSWRSTGDSQTRRRPHKPSVGL